jgi:Lrp/AsnC family leucine-responsive transcriptional regulator
VIRGYRADVDPRALGLPLSVIIRMRPAPRDLEEVIDRFALYGQTTSSILQSAPVPGRGISLPAG